MRLWKSTVKSASRAVSSRALDGAQHAALAPLRADFGHAIGALQRAARALNESVGVDPLKPQAVSRALKINKNLTWKVARVLLSQDPFEAIAMLPGPEGVEIYLKAFSVHGASQELVEQLREAFRAFDAMVEQQFGGRAELDLVLDSLRADGNLEQSRRMAYRGLSGVFGVQARLRLAASIVSPNAENAELADVSTVAALCGVRRLRPGGSLPVFRSSVRNAVLGKAVQPLLPSSNSATSEFLLRDYSSYPEASVRSVEREGRLLVELAQGLLGKPGEADLVFGSLLRGAYSRSGTPDDRRAEFVTSISFPAESFVSDVFVHRSIRGPESTRSSFHGTLSGPFELAHDRLDATQLPIDTEARIFESAVDAPAVPAMERYGDLLRDAFASLGQDMAEYRLIRCAVDFPPIPAALLIAWELPE